MDARGFAYRDVSNPIAWSCWRTSAAVMGCPAALSTMRQASVNPKETVGVRLHKRERLPIDCTSCAIRSSRIWGALWARRSFPDGFLNAPGFFHALPYLCIMYKFCPIHIDSAPFGGEQHFPVQTIWRRTGGGRFPCPCTSIPSDEVGEDLSSASSLRRGFHPAHITNAARMHRIITSSPMCESGRVLHHLAHNIENPHTIVLMVGGDR